MSNKKDGVFVNRVSIQMLPDAKSKDGKLLGFKNMLFSYQGSANKIASISLRPGQVLDCIKYGSTVPEKNYRNILLGNPGTVRDVSIKKEDGTYEKIQMTVEQIVASIADGYERYKKQKETNMSSVNSVAA